MDLLLTTVSTPCLWAISRMIRFAESASGAECMCTPRFWRLRSRTRFRDACRSRRMFFYGFPLPLPARRAVRRSTRKPGRALVGEFARSGVKGFLQRDVDQCGSRALVERRIQVWFSSGQPGLFGPERACARWRSLIFELRFDNPPEICSMQPASAATSQVASTFSADLIFSSSMAHETSGNLTANEPPNPQQRSQSGNSSRFSATCRGTDGAFGFPPCRAEGGTNRDTRFSRGASRRNRPLLSCTGIGTIR